MDLRGVLACLTCISTLASAQSRVLDAFETTFAGFHSRSGPLDESFQAIRRGPRSTDGVPETFPRFVCFPVITRFEQLAGVLPTLVPMGVLRIKIGHWRVGHTISMPARVMNGMRCFSGNISVGRQSGHLRVPSAQPVPQSFRPDHAAPRVVRRPG